MSYHYKVQRPVYPHHITGFDEHEDATHFEVDDSTGALTLATDRTFNEIVAVYPSGQWLSLRRVESLDNAD